MTLTGNMIVISKPARWRVFGVVTGLSSYIPDCWLCINGPKNQVDVGPSLEKAYTFHHKWALGSSENRRHLILDIRSFTKLSSLPYFGHQGYCQRMATYVRLDKGYR